MRFEQGVSRLPWAKFSDDTHRNEHILALSVAARWLWAASIMDNRDYKDGRSAFISTPRVYALVRQQGVAPKLIRELEESGRWEICEGGWNIHHFEEFLPTRREEAAEHQPDPIKQAAGRKGNDVRWHNDPTLVAERSQTGRPVARGPVPVPEPVPVLGSKEPSVIPLQQNGLANAGYGVPAVTMHTEGLTPLQVTLRKVVLQPMPRKETA